MTTKEKERKALDQIESILNTLDEDSWVRTAFEGCTEDARENIENDFALSMNGRWQDAEQKAARLNAELSKAETRLAEATQEIQRLIGEKAQIQLKVLSDDDLEDFLALARNEKYADEARIQQYNETIIQYAETPSDPAFLEAVRMRKSAVLSRDSLNNICKRIEQILWSPGEWESVIKAEDSKSGYEIEVIRG